MIDAVGIERALRVGCLDRERVVDHERRRGRLVSVDAVGRDSADQRDDHGKRYEPGDAPGGDLPHSRLQMVCGLLGGLLTLFDGSRPGEVGRALLERRRRRAGRLEPARGCTACRQHHQPGLLRPATIECIGAAGVKAASRTAAAPGRAPRRGATRAGSPSRRDAGPPRSTPRCTGGAASSTAARSARSRPSRRGTSPRRRRRRGERSPGRAR